MALLVFAACESTGSGGSGGPKVAESGTARGSAGGFSSQMSMELGKAGVESPVPVQVAPKEGSKPEAGSAAKPEAGSAAKPEAGSAAKPEAGSAAKPEAGSAAAETGSAKSDGSAAKPEPGKTEPGKPTAGGTSMTAVGAVKAPANRAYVKPAAEIAAIKLELEPNWERDMGEAGTFSLVVKIPNTDDTRVFSVRYGYEDENAPLDCDLYKKYLEDKGSMKVTLNRQRGAACYVEGTDQGGLVAYRFLLTYGGKRLMCHGSLYKDKDSATLGDLRDKVLMQAKKICETLAL